MKRPYDTLGGTLKLANYRCLGLNSVKRLDIHFEKVSIRPRKGK